MALPAPVALLQNHRARLGGDAPNVILPRLDDSDPMVRAVVGKLSTDPMLRLLLSANELIRTFAVVVTNIADGTSPAVHLRRFRPALPFATIARGGVVYSGALASGRRIANIVPRGGGAVTLIVPPCRRTISDEM